MKVRGYLLIVVLTLIVFPCCNLLSQIEEIEVPMSDGAKLKAVLWLPDKFRSFPVLLERTPYNRKEVVKMHKQFVDAGYAVLVQNLRGTVGSEGKWEVFKSDGWGGPGMRDGIDTVEWLKKQPWCNGNIGIMGFSASAIAGKLLLSSGIDGVKCALLVAGSDNFYDAIFENGCYRKNTIEEWGPAKETLPEIIQHPTYDEYWEGRNAFSRANLVKTPVYIVGGWFDIFQKSSIRYFEAVNSNPNSPANGKCKLIMHPLAHGAPPGELNFEDRERLNLDEKFGSFKEWFDYWLKGENNTLYEKPSVALFLMADSNAPGNLGNKWKFFDTYPRNSKLVSLYLRGGGILSIDLPNPTDSPYSTYVYDPENPTPSLGGNNLVPPSGPYDQRELEKREDLLVFTSPPLKKEMILFGAIKVRLFASTDAKDTDFGARFCDVYPDGRSMLMNEGMVKARYRNTVCKEDFIEPGKIYEYEIDLWDTALVLPPGHRIRLTIISASNPRYEPNPNTGEPFRRHTTTVKAKNNIYHSIEYPSAVVLPLFSEDSEFDSDWF
ncbi:MAG: CocE/NonD family hydrolase [Candidatus Hydrogenedentes bacterium]|nr:CocE/NonD family hydrolase [Candidatus Hydrogenedentota bacterium]